MVKMKALRDFPFGEQSRTLVRKGAEYEIEAAQVAFHEKTGRGRKVEPAKPSKSKEN